MKKILLVLLIGMFFINLASATVTVTLNSPSSGISDYSYEQPIEFNISATTTESSFNNISLWTNYGSWGLKDILNKSFNNYVYDEIDTASINSSLWTQYTSGTTVSNTETAGYIRSYASGATSEGTAYVQSNNMIDLENIENVTLQWYGYAYHQAGGSSGGNDGKAVLTVFGTDIKTLSCGATPGCSLTDTSVWTIIKNETAGINKYDIYNDGVFSQQITATNNVLKSYAYHKAGSSEVTTGEARLYYVYYYDNIISSPINVSFTSNISNNFIWNAYACDSSNTCSFASSNNTLSYKIFENSRTYNSTAYETAYETYKINITANSSLTAVSLLFNGTAYPMVNQGSGIWSYSRDLPSSVVGNNSIQFRFTYAGDYIYSDTTYQNVLPIQFGLCNATLTNDFLKLIFKDESDLSLINATIPTSTFTYYIGSGTQTKEYSYVNNTENYNYSFCATPTDKTFHITPYVQYKQGTNYPQRIWNPSVQDYTSTVTNQYLYLLSATDGIYVTFQVINTADQLISGVDVTATREIEGEDVEVASGTTSAAGSVTFWLNPDFSHTFSFSKTGYDTYTYSDSPTQTSYTITLGQQSSSQNATSRGIIYSIIPTNNYLENDTSYNFGFNLTSSYWDVSEYGYTLRLANGTIVASNSTGIEGTNLISSYNVNNQTIIYMDYYWVISGNYTNATTYWIIQNTEYEGYSLWTFFTDLKTFLNTDLFGLDNFGRNLIVFIILFFSVGIVSYKFGITSPLGVTTLMFSIIFFFDVVIGLIPTIRGIENLPTFISGIILALMILNEVRMR